MRVLVITGHGNGAGKTVVTVGLLAALRRRGLNAQAFKVGPVFEDAALHQVASGRRSVHLDGWLQEEQALREVFAEYAQDCDIALIEGHGGLFDGYDSCSSKGSTADVAKLLSAAAVFVADGASSTRGTAALLKGCLAYDTDVRVAGVICNRAELDGSHSAALQQALSTCGVSAALLGCLPTVPRLDGASPSHILRLSPAEQQQICAQLADVVEAHINVPLLVDMAGPLPEPRGSLPADAASAGAAGSSSSNGAPSTALNGGGAGNGGGGGAISHHPHKVRIGVAYDAAFCMYYTANLELLERSGAELVKFSPLHDSQLPAGLSGAYFGGAVMQHWAAALSANARMLAAVHALCAAGGVVLAEGAGLAYLSAGAEDAGTQQFYPMAGVLPLKTRVHADHHHGTHAHAHGGGSSSASTSYCYVDVHVQPACPLFAADSCVKGVCFNNLSVIEERVLSPRFGPSASAAAAAESPASTATGAGVGGGGSSSLKPYRHSYRMQLLGQQDNMFEGYTVQNVLASSVHLHLPTQPSLARQLVEKCRKVNTIAVGAAASAAAAAVASTPLRNMRSQSLPDLMRTGSGSSTPSSSLNGLLDNSHLRAGGAGGGGNMSAGPSTADLSGDLLLNQRPFHLSDNLILSASSSPSAAERGSSGGSEHLHHSHYQQQQQQRHPNHSHTNGAVMSPPPEHEDVRGKADGRGALVNQDGGAGVSGGAGAGYSLDLLSQHQLLQQQMLPPAYRRNSLGGVYCGAGATQRLTSSTALPPRPGGHSMDSPAPGSGWSTDVRGGLASVSAGVGPGPGALSGVGVTSPTVSPATTSSSLHLSSSPGTSTAPSGGGGGGGGGGMAPRASNGSAGQFSALYNLRNDVIVSLCPAATEALLAMGLGGRVTGVSDLCDFPPELRSTKRVVCSFRAPGALSPSRGSIATDLARLVEEDGASSGGAAGAAPHGASAAEHHRAPLPSSVHVDVNFLAKESPALVILPTIGLSPELHLQQLLCRRALEDAGMLSPDCTTAVLHTAPHTLDEVLDMMLQLGHAACAPRPARLLVDRLRARLRAAVSAVVAGGPDHPRPRALALLGLGPFVQAGKWVLDMLALLGAPEVTPLATPAQQQQQQPAAQLPGGSSGGGNGGSASAACLTALAAGGASGSAAAAAAAGRPELSWEQIRQAAPDVLILLNDHERSLQQLTQVAGLPGWWSLPAVRQGQVYVVEAAFFTRPGPRLVDGVEILARILYPDLFSKRAPQGAAVKLSLQGGQRCRQRLLPNYFMPWS